MPDIYVEVGKMNTSKALTDKKGEGYTVGLSVADLKVGGSKVSCKLSGELVRTPKAEMVSTSIPASPALRTASPMHWLQTALARRRTR